MLRRFTETPIPRRALNLIKNALLSLKWRVSIDDEFDDQDPELLKKVKIAEYCLMHPNLVDSWRTLMEAVVEDFLVGGYGTMEPQITPDYRRPVKLWPVDGSCVSADTEVLTKDGWKFWPEVTKEDFLATQNPKTGQFEWQKSFYLHKQKYVGELISFKGQKTDILCTPNHRWFGRRALKRGDNRILGKPEFITAEQIELLEKGRVDSRARFRIPSVSRWVGTPPTEKKVLSAEIYQGNGRGFGTRFWKKLHYEIDWKTWVAFLGIYMAEGSTPGSLPMSRYEKRKSSSPLYVQALAASACVVPTDNGGKGYGVSISQKRSSLEYSEIRQLLKKLPWKFREGPMGFHCHDKALYTELKQFGNCYTKFVPEEVKNLPVEYLKIFLEWAVKGDGSIGETGQTYYVTTSKRLADDIQELYQKVGLSAVVGTTPEREVLLFGKEYIASPRYKVGMRKFKNQGLGKPTREKYDGYVYCASVPNETLYMRRNGKPFWSGNTIRIYADWSEATPDRAHFAQLTGLKGERGIISFLDDELIYVKDNCRSSTPFGLGRMEIVFLTINAFLGIQDMGARAGADQIHKTWLWWSTNVPPGHMETVRRHIQNEAEGQAKVSLMSGLPKPEIVEVTPVTSEDLLLDWQDFLIRIIAAGFDLSPMSLGLERDVNRNTASVMAEQDFNSAVVPAARKFEDAFTRLILHRTLGWRELKFEFVGLEDPDEMVQVMLTRQLYSTNSITPDEIRDRMQIGGPLPGGWGKLTAGQLQLLIAAAAGKPPMGSGMGGGMSGGSSMGGGMNPNAGMGMGAAADGGYDSNQNYGVQDMDSSPFSAQDVAGMSPQEVQMYQQAGLLPQGSGLPQGMESQQPGILQTISEELIEYFQWLEQEEEESQTEPAKVSAKDMKEQQQKYKQRQHDLTSEEMKVRQIEKHTTQYQPQNYRGPVPGMGSRKKMFGKLKKPKGQDYTGRSR